MLTNDLGLDNEETDARIWVCDGPAGGSWADAWPDLSRYAA